MQTTIKFLAVLGASGLALAVTAQEPVVISEIMYAPVEAPAFNPDGTPVMDLTEEVHEYVELHNFGSNRVDLSGWRLTSAIHYTFPTGASIGPGEFLVVARDPARLAAVSAYGLMQATLYGPYSGQLSNQGETLNLRNALDEKVDSVTYSSAFPWPISANALGVGQRWTGVPETNYQYRGRSLERVSFTASGDDPANWLASPLPGEPSPGQPNAVHRDPPLPVVVQLSVSQAGDGQPMIRPNQAVQVAAVFSATNELGSVQLEYFLQNLNATNLTTTNVVMQPVGAPGQATFQVTVPGFPARTLVRYRIWAERAGPAAVASPRADDPFAWHGWFVSPVRSANRPSYDLFISTASLNRLAANISQAPRRVTSPDPPGYPRASWDATEPAVFVCDGVVRDVQVRYHGSRYNRGAGSQSFKIFLPRYNPLNNQSTLMVTDKGPDNEAAYALFRAAGLPAPVTTHVDLYLNNNSGISRLQIEDYNQHLLERYHLEQQLLNPGQPLEQPGELYKSMGTIESNGEGPYGVGDGSVLPPKPPYWTTLQRDQWTYPIQDHDWKGWTFFRDMLEGIWAARGDTLAKPNPNVPALRSFFLAHFDVDKMLTYLAVLNWMTPWDDTTQNYFLWQQVNGNWSLLPWDMDAMFGDSTVSIFAGEVGDRSNNYRGPNYFKDSFIKAFRAELKERVFLLNNTLLLPGNISALGYPTYSSYASARLTSVNQQCGLGVFTRPTQPVNRWPSYGDTAAWPANLVASPYSHTASPPPAQATTTWEIRAANGTYLAPVFKLNSATNLTTLPIPFASLTLGATCFWRCTYFDTNGHPSLASVETAFVAGPPDRRRTSRSLPSNSSPAEWNCSSAPWRAWPIAWNTRTR